MTPQPKEYIIDEELASLIEDALMNNPECKKCPNEGSGYNGAIVSHIRSRPAPAPNGTISTCDVSILHGSCPICPQHLTCKNPQKRIIQQQPADVWTDENMTVSAILGYEAGLKEGTQQEREQVIKELEKLANEEERLKKESKTNEPWMGHAYANSAYLKAIAILRGEQHG